MRKFLKLVSVILIISLIASVFPAQLMAQQTPGNPADSITQGTAKKEAQIVGEVLEKRGRNVKQFLKDDLSMEAAIYPETVHYIDDSGKWKDIDNTLVEAVDETNAPVLKNKDNGYSVSIAKNANAKKLVKIEKDGYSIAWGVDNLKSSKVQVIPTDTGSMDSLSENKKRTAVMKTNSAVKFPEVFSGIDLEYEIKPESVKEFVVLNRHTDNNEFTFNIYPKGLSAKLQADKTIVFYDDKDSSKEVFRMQAPFMFDAKGVESKAIEVKLTGNKNLYKLTLKPDSEWLSARERAYPVKIDPSVTTENLTDPNLYYQDVTAASVHQEYPTSSFSSLSVHGSLVSKEKRALIKFKLPELTSSDVVTKATLKLYCYTGMAQQVNAHRVTQPWDSSTLTWNNQPGYDVTPDDFQAPIESPSEVEWNITDMAKDWYTYGNNYGIELIGDMYANAVEFANVSYAQNNGCTVPVITIEFRSNTGLEGYMTYHSLNVGRAGTGYVNDYSGNLIFTHNDISTNGNRMPVTINHVFNSCERQNNIGFGNGWRTNLNQTLKGLWMNTQGQFIYPGAQHYFVYTDEDGTKHYFPESESGEYTDESGLGLKLTGMSDSVPGCTITDKSGNKLNFDNEGKLISISDNNNNTQTINYNGSLISSVTDGAGRTTTLNYTNGLLSSIVDPDGSTTSFEYTGNNLTKITYPDTKFTTYVYDANTNLTSAVNHDGYKVTVSYYGSVPYRVQKVLEGNSDGTLGQELNITYGNNSAVFTDVKGRKNYYTFNDYGNTISVRDSEGNAQYSSYSRGSNVNNKLSLQSKLQRSVMNYVKNHNAEADSDWTSGSWPGSEGSCAYSTESKFLGNRSLKITKTNTATRHLYYQPLTLVKGNTYTISGYVKTSGVSNTNGKGAVVFFRFADSAGNWQTVDSGYANGTSDWRRYDATFTLPANSSSNTVYAAVGITEETGTAYFDCLQVEDGKAANRYNIIENPDFTYGTDTPSFWTKNSNCVSGIDTVLTSTDAGYPSSIDKRYFKVKGEVNLEKKLSQRIYTTPQKGDVYTVGCWAKGGSAPLDSGSNRSYQLEVEIGTQKTTFPFNIDSSEWQYVSGRVSIDSIMLDNYITVSLAYANNMNEVIFDGVQLYKEEFGTVYKYDANGNLTSTSDTLGLSTQYQYNTSNDLIKTINPNTGEDNYVYDDKHNLLSYKTAENVANSFTYDSYGNKLTSKVGDDTLFVKSSSTYTDNGNYAKTSADPSGSTVTYNYNQTKGTLDSVADAKSKTTSYVYDSMDRLTDVSKSADGIEVKNSYTYENDRLKTITHNGFSYSFSYDSMGNNTQVSAAGQPLITNTYEDRTGKLLESTYGNGQKVSSDYDILDRVTARKYNGTIRSKYTYNASGNVAYQEDLVNGINYKYIYDLSERLMRIEDSAGNSVGYEYGADGSLNKINEMLPVGNRVTAYEYDKDNRIKKVTISNGSTINYLYDSVGRLSAATVTSGTLNYATEYSYAPGANSSSTNRLEKIRNNGREITYTYDANGNIETIAEEGKTIKYYYNELNEVIREDILVDSQKSSDQWTQAASIPSAKAYSAAATIGNSVYVMGGYSGSYHNRLQAYDTIFGTWTDKTVMPTARAYFSAVELNGKIYAIGGYNANGYLNTLEEYNPATDTWTTKAAMPTARAYLGAAAVNGKIYAIGGINQSGYLNTVEEYNPATDTWTAKAVMPTGRHALGAAALNGKIYAVGGRNGTSDALKVVEEYNPGTNTWSTKTGMLKSRRSFGLAAANGRLYAFGGSNSSYSEIIEGFGSIPSGTASFSIIGRVKTTEEYDPATNTWVDKADKLTGRVGLGTAVVNDRIYAIGGTTGEYTDKVEEYSPLVSSTITYSYDAGGNILNKRLYRYTTGVPASLVREYSYTYDAIWKDKMATFDGKAISYDAIGNPLTYNGWTYTWEEGRQLASTSGNGLNMAFKYNDQGIRTEKTVNGIVTKYRLVDDRVTFETNGTDSICYTYDNSNNLVSMNLNGVEYYYVRNGQGDIIGLIDSTGAQVVSYTYDTWGKLVSITGSLASTVGVKNPYRYRGYRYDTETGYYYCQSRYYNPEWGRWLNADNVKVMKEITESSIKGSDENKDDLLIMNNFCAYCTNNPINNDDNSGYYKESKKKLPANKMLKPGFHTYWWGFYWALDNNQTQDLIKKLNHGSKIADIVLIFAGSLAAKIIGAWFAYSTWWLAQELDTINKKGGNHGVVITATWLGGNNCIGARAYFIY